MQLLHKSLSVQKCPFKVYNQWNIWVHVVTVVVVIRPTSVAPSCSLLDVTGSLAGRQRVFQRWRENQRWRLWQHLHLNNTIHRVESETCLHTDLDQGSWCHAHLSNSPQWNHENRGEGHHQPHSMGPVRVDVPLVKLQLCVVHQVEDQGSLSGVK